MSIQHTDIYNPTAPAINYAGPGKTWTIANGVLVGSGSAPAVYSGFNGSKLVNKGDVFSSYQLRRLLPGSRRTAPSSTRRTAASSAPPVLS